MAIEIGKRARDCFFRKARPEFLRQACGMTLMPCLDLLETRQQCGSVGALGRQLKLAIGRDRLCTTTTDSQTRHQYPRELPR